MPMATSFVKCWYKAPQAQDFWAIRNRGHFFATDMIFLFHFNDQALIDKVSVNWDHYEWRRQLGAGVGSYPLKISL